MDDTNRSPKKDVDTNTTASADILDHRPSRRASYLDLFLRMVDTICLIDTDDFRILDINDAGEKFFQKTPELLAGQIMTQWVIPEQREVFDKFLRVARRRYYPREWESFFAIEDKQVAVRLSACMLRLSDEKEVIQVIVKDITKEVESAQKIKLYIGELEVLNQKLESLSTTDEMTKLNNFRQFKSQLVTEHQRAQRYSGMYSLVFFDVDNFKHYNDRNGHPAGDVLLQKLAELIRAACRDTDIPARYGGEEFVILCPATHWKNAMILADRVRESVATYPFEHAAHQPLGKVSVSIGVSSFPTDGDTASEVLEAADQALYYSKHHGKNCTTSYREMKKDKPEGTEGGSTPAAA